MGRATLRGGIDSDQIRSILSDLRTAARALNTTGPLHLLYLCVPARDAIEQVKVDWAILFESVTHLSGEAGILGLIGFTEAYLMRKATTGHAGPVCELFYYLLFYLLLASGSIC
ncbi:unnamed protein product [Protopolystoma xenopodis]|uniref:POLQ-like helical domain-containing protein n=1 Tax=Protopolystoma xenopodis TaxID=117903 RepID=A0A448XGK4_9PLAT|nr:unnamed protein product [Protopolystoma xenopodis]